MHASDIGWEWHRPYKYVQIDILATIIFYASRVHNVDLEQILDNIRKFVYAPMDAPIKPAKLLM